MLNGFRSVPGGDSALAMMPLLCALGQHQALRSVQSQLRPSEGYLAFHDDIHVVISPERTCEVHTILWDNSRIQIHVGKTQMWNRAGGVPRDFDKLLRAGQAGGPTCQTLVWGFVSTARGTWHPCFGGTPWY